jgi:mannitol/fructose-specific phosphotransferase system IIA component (Ntr-type)
VKLSELLTPDRIRIPLAARTKADILRELVSLLGKSPEAADAVLAAVLERESRLSTGIGRGVAIPHGKTRHANGLEMSFGIAAAPVDYGSIDREPVRVFFLLISPPDQSGPHIRALAQISRMLSGDAFQDDLLAARSAGDVAALLTREEAGMEE